MISLLFAAGLVAVGFQDETDLCVDARNCRYVGSVDVQVDDRMLRADINSSVPFVAEDGLTLFVGESVVLALAADGQVVVESHSPASEVITDELLQHGAAVVAEAGQAALDGAVPASGPRPLGAGPVDRLRISFSQVPGSDETILLVENGYGRRIDYRAIMQVPGAPGPQATTACQVLPNLMGIEHWPHAIGVITLSNFHVAPDGGQLACD